MTREIVGRALAGVPYVPEERPKLFAAVGGDRLDEGRRQQFVACVSHEVTRGRITLDDLGSGGGNDEERVVRRIEQPLKSSLDVRIAVRQLDRLFAPGQQVLHPTKQGQPVDGCRHHLVDKRRSVAVLLGRERNRSLRSLLLDQQYGREGRMGRSLVLPQRVTIPRHHPLTDDVTIDGVERVILDDVVPSVEKFFQGFPIAVSANQELYGVSPPVPTACSVGHG
nr:hypothetical protein [Halobaculum rubrum]